MTIYNQRKNVIGRNGRIWMAYCSGANAPALAEAFDLSEQRIYQILKQCERDFPVEEREQIKKRRVEFLDMLRQQAMEIALMEPAPAFAPNGKPHYDPETGRPVYDYGTRLAAIDRLLKIDERFAKATGTDHAVEHTVQVSADAERATQDAADKAGAQFSLIIPESPEVLAHAHNRPS